jgi:hypothetical protein
MRSARLALCAILFSVAGATTTTGNYTIPALPAGPYSLGVEAPGFRKSVQTGILVAVASNIRVDVTMWVGATSDSVTVNADVPLLKTEDAEQSHR